MNNILSVIIPARNEKYLQKTIENVLENATGEIEILAVLDGYLPEPVITVHPGEKQSVQWIYNPEAIGQRASINKAARMVRGQYVMKLDAHCAVAKGFDEQLIADAQHLGKRVIQVPRMYNLDINTWEPKLRKRTDYMYIGLRENGELRAEYYSGEEYRRQHRKTEEIDDIMCCMGPCFFLDKDFYWEIGGCDEGHGGQCGWGQQGIEMACKAWLSGGRMVVNKKTWFSHWFRGDVGFPYYISGKDVAAAREYSKSLWLGNKWEKQTRKFQFLLDKFNPPGWEGYEKKDMQIDKQDIAKQFDTKLRTHLLKNKLFPVWMGTKITKYPSDILLYQEIIYNNKPDFIIDVGTNKGGSALFFANICDLLGHGQVISIDKYTGTGKKGPYSGGIVETEELPKHPRITYLIGGSTAYDILESVKAMVGDGSVMVSLDSCHDRGHVKREMTRYDKIVTKGQYMVVEDTHMGEEGPLGAVNWYMSKYKTFEQVPLEDRYLISLNPKGWLKKL